MTAVTIDSVISAVEQRHDPSVEAFIAFDGDGTLWSGDIGEDLFHHCVARDLIFDEAREALDRMAARFGILVSGSATARAQQLFEAYLAGRLPERQACEMMVWVYAGWRVDALAEQVDAAFEAAGLWRRMHAELERVVAEARRRSIRTLVISASPAVAVRQAVRAWGFGPDDVLAGTSVVHDRRVGDAMAEPLPYGPDKVAAARRHMQNACWLASFGDNGFDVDMLRAAEIAVAVWPKPALKAALPGIEGAVVVEPERYRLRSAPSGRFGIP